MRRIIALIIREMSSTYGKHPGGYLWAIIEPIAALTILTIVFSLAFRAPALGDNFPLFYATGYLPFMLYNDVANKTSGALRFSKQLLFYPALNYSHAVIARFSINFVTQSLVFLIVMTGLLYLINYRSHLNYNAILTSICLTSLLAMGIGSFNCYFSTRYPIWDRVWSIINRPAFIVSGIFFIFEGVPEPIRSILWYNPLIHIIGLMRQGFYPSYTATYVSEIYVITLSLCLSTCGILLLHFKYKDLINRL